MFPVRITGWEVLVHSHHIHARGAMDEVNGGLDGVNRRFQLARPHPCGPSPSSPPWHPCPSMALATADPRAQPTTHRSMQTAMSCTVLAHRLPGGWPTTYDRTPCPPPAPDSPPSPRRLCSLWPLFRKRCMVSEMSPENMANPNGLMFRNMASTSCLRLGRYHDLVPTVQCRRKSLATAAQLNGLGPCYLQ